MKLALVGVGNAGCRIVDHILARERATGRDVSHGNVLVINTDPTVFDTLEQVPPERRLVIGELHPDSNGEGVDGDVDRGVAVASEEQDEIRRAFDAIDPYGLDGTLVVAGLGGGTGGGAGAVVLDALQSMYEDPVYVLGVLPDAADTTTRSLTAARALLTIVPRADNTIVFDNETWTATDTDEDPDDDRYDAANRALATRIVALFGVDEHDDSAVPEAGVDASDIERTLEIGGVSTIGYASTPVANPASGWWGRVVAPWLPISVDAIGPSEATVTVRNLVERALTEDLTLPCAVESTERAVLILSGPPIAMSRQGFEHARHWLEEELDPAELRAGDEPLPRSSTLDAVILLSNVTDVPRIDVLKERAVSLDRERSKREFGWVSADDS